MSIGTRWRTWQFVVVGALVADALVASRGSVLAAIVGTVLLIAMCALLTTTPSDAIVLPRARSERIVLIGSIAVYATAWPTGASAILAVFALVIDVVLLIACRRVGASAWWSAMFAWQPVLVMVMRHASIATTPG